MRAGRLMSAWAMLLVSTPIGAQTSVSGSWGGTLGPDRGDGTPATLALTADTRGSLTGVITGPKLIPGDLKGTHDAKTGAVSFRVTLRADGNQAFDFVGAISHDTLIARGGDKGTREFTLRVVKGRKAPALAAASSSGPKQEGDAASAAARRTFTEVSGWVSRAAALVPPDKYSFRPTASVRTFGQLVGHVADGYVYYCTRASGKEIEWSDRIEKSTYDKTAVTNKLKEAEKLCNDMYGKGQIGALIENVGHANLHYGNIVTYMRMLGLTPPSS